MSDENGAAQANLRPIRVLTVDDHPLLREGVAAVLERHPDMVLVGEASSGREAVVAFKHHRPDVTLMDLRLPDISGVEVIAEIRREFSTARFIVLTTYSGDFQAVQALKAGASAYLLKDMLRKDLVDTIRAVQAGKRHIPASIAAEIAQHSADESLTAREMEILKGVASGKSNKSIAADLAISEGTVRAHMKKILPKLNATGRTHAVVIALKRGMLDV